MPGINNRMPARVTAATINAIVRNEEGSSYSKNIGGMMNPAATPKTPTAVETAAALVRSDWVRNLSG